MIPPKILLVLAFVPLLSLTARADKIHFLSKTDKSKVIGSVGEGKTFGEMALIDREPRSASVVAVSDTILIVLHLTEFNDMSDSSPRLALKILHRIAKLLSHRLRQTSGVLADFLDD